MFSCFSVDLFNILFLLFASLHFPALLADNLCGYKLPVFIYTPSAELKLHKY